MTDLTQFPIKTVQRDFQKILDAEGWADSLTGGNGTLSATIGQIYREVEALASGQEANAVTSIALFNLLAVVGQLSDQVNGGRAALAGGTLADPALRIGTVGIYSAAADTLSVAIGGVEVARLTASGLTVYGTVTEA